MRLRRTNRLDEYFFAETPEVLNHAWGFPELRAPLQAISVMRWLFSCAGSSIGSNLPFHECFEAIFQILGTSVFQLAFCSQAIMMGRHPRLRLGGNAEMPFSRGSKL